MTKKDGHQNIRIIESFNIVNEIKRFKQELTKAKQSLEPPCYSFDRGGFKVIEKVRGVVEGLISVDHENEKSYKELLKELDSMKDDSQKLSANGRGLSPSIHQDIQPYNTDIYHLEEAFMGLPLIQRDRLVSCSQFSGLYTSLESLTSSNLEINKGVLLNWLIGIDIIDDPLEGEQFLAELVAEPSFNLIRANSSSRILISPGFIWCLESLSYFLPESGREKVSSAGPFAYRWRKGNKKLLMMVNKSTYRLNEQVIKKPRGLDEADNLTLQVVHLGNIHRGMGGHVMVEDTFISVFDRLLKEEKDVRFLSLRGILRIQRLPHSVCKLKKLRVLDLRSCQDLISLPNDIGSLIELVCLDLSECYQLNHIPYGITLLTELRVLLGFIITDNLQQPKDSNERFAEFDDLEHLTKLIKLSIRTRRVSFPTNEDLKTLNLMQELRTLKITWVKAFVLNASANVASEKYVYTQGLPKTIEKLELQAPPDDSTASRLLELSSHSSIHSLEKLYIRGCSLQKLYSDQYSFPHVKRLLLRHLPQLHMDWQELKLLFPSLSYLHIYECPYLTFLWDKHGEWNHLGN